jgi:Tfp pilus assembly major pilin PilA
MTVQSKSKQRGITFLGLVFVGAVVGISGVIAAQVFPTVLEYQMVAKAVNKAQEGNSVVEIRTIFDKAASIDAISSVSGKDLEITKEGDKVVVRFAYEREMHLVGPAWLTLKYAGRSK